MNFTRTAVTSAVVLLSTISNRGVHAQSLDSMLAQVTSNEYAVRKAGFYKIFALANKDSPASLSLRPHAQRLAKYAHQNPAVATALIALLERENRPDPAKSNLTEDMYYGDLIGCVAELKDPRAVNGLLGAISTGGLAENGLAALGSAAVPGLLRTLRSPREDQFARAAAAGVLGVLAQRRDVVIDTAVIKSGLVAALSDPSMYVRRDASGALSPFSDPAVRHAMEALAAKDTAVRVRSGKRVYPVRAAALMWLRRDDSLKVSRPPR